MTVAPLFSGASAVKNDRVSRVLNSIFSMVIVDILFQKGQGGQLPKSFYAEVVRETLALSGMDFLSEKELSVSAVATDDDDVRRINHEYRGMDRATDILSFHEYRSQKALKSEPSTEIFLGELIFSVPFIERSAKKDRVSLRTEMAFIVSHGILHLLGFRHGERMFGIQERVVDRTADGSDRPLPRNRQNKK
jgi:probable rRNA maturation factor